MGEHALSREPPVSRTLPGPLLGAVASPPSGLASLPLSPPHLSSGSHFFSFPPLSSLSFISLQRPSLPPSSPTPPWLPRSCPAVQGSGWGPSDVTGCFSGPRPAQRKFHPPFSLNQFTFIASAAQKQFFKNKKVSTSKTNQFLESSCRQHRGAGAGGPCPSRQPPPTSPSAFIAS